MENFLYKHFVAEKVIDKKQGKSNLCYITFNNQMSPFKKT